MEFRLVYQGPLKTGGKDNKHEIRCKFHPQLRKLWEQPPLQYYVPTLPMPPQMYPPPKYVLEPHVVGDFKFRPLVTAGLNLIAQLDILLLRPEPPGALIVQGGDIDNRLKTLFDALRMPKEAKELPGSARPGAGETPFFCLLEDDALVTAVSVDTDKLLEETQSADWVHLFIRVRVRGTTLTGHNIALIG